MGGAMSGENLEPYLDKILVCLKRCEDLRPKLSLEEIQLNTQLRADLGLDSLALMSLVYELQEEFPRLDESHIPAWKTMGDVASALKTPPCC